MSPRFFEPFAGRSQPPIVDWAGGVEFDLRGIGEGSVRTYCGDDAQITVGDVQFHRDIRYRAVLSTDALLIRASLANSCAYVQNGETWSFQRPVVAVSALPRGTVLDVGIAGGLRQRAVTVLLEPQSLLAHHRLEPGDLPEPLRRLAGGELDRPCNALTMPIQTDIASLVQDVVHSRLTGALRRMQVQARASELLALVAASWNERLELTSSSGVRSRRDAEIIAAARRILTERFADPPTLLELSSELGTNKNKLNQLFQQTLGTTPQAFCLQQRIGRAQALLIEGQLSIGQVADAVGYQHQSSFAVAFRDVVGESPREFARRSRPGRLVAIH
ncbi:helix-turn-helix transcriptional regulator [Roseateles violae]|uniref:AraC family transcriptional regulator n=1 Tax=Roseateles violae TaxID=3058042 RepID=A0ABT8DVH4_9BURK|nr:AraC family transcriptional regulator [Pelomonas sp. PFR6]MDN3922148.1 AraC family transcriptional regulator [Pelomonas sp. PFR6]